MGRGFTFAGGPTEPPTFYEDKTFSSLRARAALCGGMLHRQDDDRGEKVYILTLAGWTRPMSSIDAVEAAIERAESLGPRR